MCVLLDFDSLIILKILRIALEIIKCANCRKNLLKQKLTTTRIIINIFSIMRKNHKKSRKIGQCK
ncbi:hypothetical protein CQA40_00210 [Helicobacter sp. MIT 01-3238]|nr:hypothetical protein CQA40_00210 [Helicobacter sp. MIT 01-3238]